MKESEKNSLSGLADISNWQIPSNYIRDDSPSFVFVAIFAVANLFGIIWAVSLIINKI
jgi:hypothetical protein